MAASGFTPIQLYRSATPGAVPTAANLAPGELALNTADQKLFFENASGVVVSIDTANGTVTSVNASGGTTGLTFSGGPITTSGTLTLAGTLAVANGGTGVTSSTGTVAVVLSNSPTLVTPTLGAASATSIANGLGAVGTPSYTFTGDLNTGMWSPGTDTVAFSTNGAERMRIDSSGNVGIGTSSLNARLSLGGLVSNKVFALYDDGTNQYGMGIAGSEYRMFAATGANLCFGNYARSTDTFTETVRIDSAGNVGIGTSSPSNLLHIARSSGNAILRVQDTSSTSDTYYISDSSGTSITQTGALPVILKTSNTERMRIDSSGNVGIGTTSPGYRLDVASGDTTASVGYAMRIRSNATATAASLQFTNSGASAQNGVIICTDAGTMTLQSDGASSLLAFRTNGNERMRIGSDGHVGMGTSTRLGTNETLSVSAISTFDGMWVKNLAAAAATMVVWNAATSGDNSFIGFGTEAAVTNRGSITYNRAGGLVAYNVTSDYRAKDIIGPVTDAGATIDALKVYSGKMKGATLVRPMLVAHEAQEVVPYAVTGEKDAVNEDGTDKYQHMDHQSLVPLLIAEVQSLRARVAQLEATTSTIKFEGE